MKKPEIADKFVRVRPSTLKKLKKLAFKEEMDFSATIELLIRAWNND